MTVKELIDISQNDDILVCKITVPPRDYRFPKTVIYNTGKVVEMLLTKGFDIDQILEHAHVSNKPSRSSKRTGEWKFKLVSTKKQVAKKPPRPRAKKPKTKISD